MTRRGAIAALAAITAALTNRTQAQEKTTGTFTYSDVLKLSDPITPLTFDLHEFKSYTFVLGSDRVTLTPEQMMAELLGHSENGSAQKIGEIS